MSAQDYAVLIAACSAAFASVITALANAIVTVRTHNAVKANTALIRNQSVELKAAINGGFAQAKQEHDSNAHTEH